MSTFTKKDVIKKSLNVVTRKDAGTTNTLKKKNNQEVME